MEAVVDAEELEGSNELAKVDGTVAGNLPAAKPRIVHAF
jgi:hypothetical protein